MAKKKEEKQETTGVTELDAGDAAVPVVAVRHPGEDADDDFNQEQNEALLHYKATGQVGVYIDPSRDQEPDIAPELGVSPHPELANPAPPEKAWPSAQESTSPVVETFEAKQENAEAEEERVQAATDAENEANQAAYEAEKERRSKPAEEQDLEPPAELSAQDALNRHLVPDESPKSSSNVGPGTR